MHRFIVLLVGLALGTAAACDSPSQERPNGEQPLQETTQEVTGPPIDYVYGPENYWKLKTKRSLFAPAKADGNDDVRWKSPQNYAITHAPANIATVRPMVEWEPMKSIVLQWPAGYLTHSKNASQTMLNIAKNAATVAEVWIVTNPEGEPVIKQALLEHGLTQEQLDNKVKILPTMIDSIWFIDSGPFPIVDTASNTYAFSDFRYYHERPLDDGVSTVLGRHLPEFGHDAVETYRMPLNVEGGTLQATSDGICFTGTRQLYYMSCATGSCDPTTGGKPDWHQGGNEYVSMADSNSHPLAEVMRKVWKEYIGCKDVIITNSVTDDGTGHIDMYLKVLDDKRVMLGQYEAPFAEDTRQEENALLQDETAAYLENYVKPDGTTFEVVRLVMPGHRNTNDGTVPFTYINSTFINGLNLWPATEFPEWEASRAKAEAQWKAALPDMEHIWIDSTELSFWSGAIHCITRTVPDLPEGAWVGDGTCGDNGICAAPTDGYSGECQPHFLSEAVCWGPEWLCDCNDCDTGCTYEPAPYEGDCSDGIDNDEDGNIDCVDVDCASDAACSGCPEWLSYAGCCIEGVMKYCDGGSRVANSCEFGCGWSESGSFYDCAGGDTNAVTGASDPSGDNPMDCAELANSGTCQAECDGKACGDDGCGGSCGECSGSDACSDAGMCVSICENACEAAGEKGCGEAGVWECQENADGCLVQVVVEACSACTDGVCATEEPPVTQPPGDDGGDTSGACNSGGEGRGFPVLLLSLVALGLVIRRRGGAIDSRV